MHHDLNNKLSFEFELFRISILAQSREAIFTRSDEIFYKTRIFKGLNELNNIDAISFDLKQKMMLKSDIIDSVYMYLTESTNEIENIKEFVEKYIEKVIKPIRVEEKDN